MAQDLLNSLAGQSPAGANPNPGATAPPAQVPGAPVTSGGAPTTGAAPPQGDLLDALAANPDLGAPPPAKLPGSFGAYDPDTESEMLGGPLRKGVMESLAHGFGFHEIDPTVGEALGETWDNLAQGAQKTYQDILKRRQQATGQEAGVLSKGAAALVGVPLEMMGNGILGMIHGVPQGVQMIEEGLKNPGLDADGVTGRQRVGRGLGTIISSVMQMAMMVAGDEAGGEVGSAGAADALEDLAAKPGNEMVRARKGNFQYGKNPGDYLVDEPVKPPVNATRLGQLENVRAQNVAHGDALHAQVDNLLQGAKNLGVVQPNGAVRVVPNLLDWASEVEDAADEMKVRIQKMSLPASEAKAAAKAIDGQVEGILNERDLQGNVTQPKNRLGTPTEVNAVKKSVGEMGNYQKIFTDAESARKAGLVNDFLTKAYGKLKDQVDGAVGGPAGRRVNDLNRRYSNAIEFRRLLDDEILKEKGTGGLNAAARKGEWFTAAGAVATGHPWLAAGLALNRLLRSVPGRVMQAKGLAAAGAALRSPAVRIAAPAAGAVAGSVPAVSGAAARTLAGQETQ